jgi:hypothetical protein
MRRDVQVIGIMEVETFSIGSEIGDISRVLHAFHACLCRTAFPQVQQADRVKRREKNSRRTRIG